MPVVMTTKTVARKAMINLLVRVEFIAGQRSLYSTPPKPACRTCVKG
jgi:hypothetical protein